jgi:putative FmdB family regulatory protein
MPLYVYRCPNAHEIEVTHKITEDPEVICPECGDKMRRKPQTFRFSLGAQSILYDWMDENYRWYRKYPRDKSKRFSPDEVKRPGKPVPGTQAHTRRSK